MISDLTGRSRDGELGHLLTDEELADESREARTDFEDPQYIHGQLVAQDILSMANDHCFEIAA